MSQVLFGAMASPLWQQLKWPHCDCEVLQKKADAITFLLIHQILTDAEGHRARLRLVKHIQREHKRREAAA